MFSTFIVWYLFLAGMGGGSFMVASLCAGYDAVVRSDASELLAVRTQYGFLIAPLFIAIATLFLAMDLGSPEQAWLVLFTPLQSIVSAGAWFVGLFLVLSCVVVFCGLFVRTVPAGFLWLAWIGGSLLGLGVMAYTGLLLSGLVAVDFWHTWLLPLLFVVSSFATGLAVVLAADAVFGKTVYGGAQAHPLWSTAAVLGMVEAVALTVFLLDRFAFSDAARMACEQLLFGAFAAQFWLGIAVCGIAVPLALHLLCWRVAQPGLVLIASASVLVGGFFMRYCIVQSGALTPLALGGFS